MGVKALATTTPPKNAALLRDLTHLLGSGAVSADARQRDAYAGDALGVYRAFGAAHRLNARPAAVAWPSSTAQVSAVLKLANRIGAPVVPYGGGTGVMGAAVASDGCIVLNLQRMNAICGVSRRDMTIRAQAGLVLQDAASALDAEGLLLGHDPWSRPIATVGGALSTNGVGYTAAKYGSMGEQAMGLEAVLPDGEIVRTAGVPKRAYGPSLAHLLIGTEGTLGVITEATLRAFPRPERRILRAIDFPDFESGFEAVVAMYAEGVRPAMLDYGEELWRDGESTEPDATVYLAFEGFAEDAEVHDARARRICLAMGGQLAGAEEIERFWRTRHASGERYLREVLRSDDPARARKRRSEYRMEYLHVGLPVSRVLEYRRRCQAILGERRAVVREWSLWARPEMLSFLFVEEDDDGGPTSGEMGAAVDSVLTLAQDMGGTMEYCHGVGVKLAHLMERELGAGMNAARKIKRALDPNGILNPGKQLG